MLENGYIGNLISYSYLYVYVLKYRTLKSRIKCRSVLVSTQFIKEKKVIKYTLFQKSYIHHKKKKNNNTILYVKNSNEFSLIYYIYVCTFMCDDILYFCLNSFYFVPTPPPIIILGIHRFAVVDIFIHFL